MPQYPYIESALADMTVMYYGDSSPKGVSGKHDIDSESYLLAETLHQIAVLGGSAKDVADTALLVVANSVMDEMVVSVTAEVLETVAEAHNYSVDDEFARYLLGRAEATLTGMAYVGACRSIAWTISRHRPSRVRAAIIESARREYRRVCARTGYADLVADDAHIHLRTAERIAIPDDPEVRRQRVEAAQICATFGCRLLAMAFALASDEVWNPFVAQRLSAELKEHVVMLDAVATFSPRDRTDLDIAHHELTEHWSEATSIWRDLVAGGSHDIGAFFKVRAGAPNRLANPSSTTAALRDGESAHRRML